MSEFGERTPQPIDEADRMSIEAIGVTFDYLNEILFNPDNDSAVDKFMEECVADKPKTYSERFAKFPELITASDPEKVAKIDQLMTEARGAAKAGDRETVKNNLIKMKEFFKM